MSEKTYRTVLGIVQFDPREGEAAGKAVRNIVVNQTGFGNQAVKVYATIWPSHESVKIARNDVVLLEGSYTSQTKQKDDGDKVTYHNLSVTRLAVLGKASDGQAPATTSADEDVEDEDTPF